MSVADIAVRNRDSLLVGCLILTAAALVAVAGARDHVGGWNDGSRLATVECLVDHHTLAIDRSGFTPATGDKLFINGHYYSDKSPVPALLLAAVYWLLQSLTGLTAAGQPNAFCYALTLACSGVPYVVAVWCVYRLGRPLRLPSPLRLYLTFSFALATVALPYTRHVNNHILLLGVTAVLVLNLAWLAEESGAGRVSRWRLFGLGTLAGLGYSIDLGAGPVLLVCTAAVVAYRCRRLPALAVFALGALPWLALHHALNYAVGGTFKPANAVPAYFQWPGCPFTPANLTGGWNHDGIGHFLTYAAALLFGKHGFVGHNLPLFLALPGAVLLLRRRTADMPEVLFAGCCCGGVWLIYALTSNNYSGQCCSIRWFVPLLAPGYYLLALQLRRHPQYLRDVLVLSGWGLVMAGLMWPEGPWRKHLVPFFWPVQAAALLSWGACHLGRRRQGWAEASRERERPEERTSGRSRSRLAPANGGRGTREACG